MTEAREDEPTQRIHIYMYSRDIQDIKAVIGRQSDMSKYIRKVVRVHMDKLRERARMRQLERGEKTDD